MINVSTIQPYFTPNSTIIVGFSGGPDSVCLLTLLHELAPKLNLTIIAAHLDHQWREESCKDALWCKKFCEASNNIACEIYKASDLNFNVKYNGSEEEVGRILRRALFEKLATKYQANYIALAHHTDDQLETFFIRLARGASIAGLSGMKIFDGLYLRPLLHVSKQEILDYLTHHKINFLTDSTNLDPKYLRNRIRHELMPTLHQIDNRLTQNIAQCMTHLQKTDNFLHQTMMQTIQKISNQSMIQTESFLNLHEIMQHRIFMHLFITNNIALTPSTALFKELLRFLRSNKNSTHQLHPTISIIKHADHFYFKSL